MRAHQLMLFRLLPGLALGAGLLAARPASGQVVCFGAGKWLGVGLGYTRGARLPGPVWRTGTATPPPGTPVPRPRTSGLSLSLVADLTPVASGLCLAPMTVGEVRNGLVGGLVGSRVDTLRGVGLGGWVWGERLSGVCVGMLGVGGEWEGRYACEQLSGVAFSYAQVQARVLHGVAAAAYVRTRQQRGLAVALFNHCQELHGVQVGLLNHAANNPPGLRWLPGLNLHLRDEKLPGQ